MLILPQNPKEIRPISCATIPGTAAWEKHLVDLKQLATKAERLKLYPLPLELAYLLLEHRALEWSQVEAGNA